MKHRSRILAFSVALAGFSTLLVAACSNESQSVPTSPQSSIYLQVDRLGRPGVKEIFEPYSDHNSSDRAVPLNDQVLQSILTAFPSVSGGTAGSAVATTLWPDVLQMNLTGTSASYLAIEFGQGGFGGRALTDDVMSADLGIAYGGRLGGTTATRPCAATDNVSASAALVSSAHGSFPYLAAPQ
jgi:hypothetical protein